MRKAIGIDPDSKGSICFLVEAESGQTTRKGHLCTSGELKSLINWIKKEGDVIVALEGSNGQCKPLEKAFRKANIVFYSFKASDVEKFRKAVVSQNKNNAKDAETVARYALALECQGKLEQYRRVWFPDEQLQLLTRAYERTTKKLTAEINMLWKSLRAASPDLYLALAGYNPDVDINSNVLQKQGVLTILKEKPNLVEWKTLSDAHFWAAMGGRNYRGREKIFNELRKLSEIFEPTAPALMLMIRSSAQTILHTKQYLAEIRKVLGRSVVDNQAIKALEEYRGISLITAATIVAEIIDIRRFVNDDRLASYAGLGMREYSSGDRNKMIPNRFLFNHRLKDAFITAAKNFVRFNPDSHLSGYFRYLTKKGMSRTEAYKRVARALVRVFFKKLKSLIKVEDSIQETQKGRESDMASGQVRSEKTHISNTPLISPHKYFRLSHEKINSDYSRLRSKNEEVKKIKEKLI
jgi:transposase